MGDRAASAKILKTNSTYLQKSDVFSSSLSGNGNVQTGSGLKGA